MIHRRLLQLAGAVPGAILALAGVGLALSALNIVFAIAAGSVIAALVRGDHDLVDSVTVLAAITVVRGLVIWAREPMAARVGASVRIRLRRRLLTRLAAIPTAERDSGTAAATVIDGVDGLDAYYTRYLPQLIVVILVPAATVLLAATHSSGAGAVLAVAAAVAVIAPRAWDARLLRNGRDRWGRFTRLSSDYVEALQQTPLLRSFGASGRVSAQLSTRAEDLRRSTMAQLRVSVAETFVSSLALHLGTVLAVVAAVTAVISGSTGATAAVTVLLLARECFRPVQDLGTHWHAGYLGLTAVDGLDRLLSTPPSIRETGVHADPAVEGLVEIVDLTYRYPGTDTGVAGLRLRIAPGETVAVVGPSGSGKSTLARLLEREIDPDGGRVRIDDVDLREYTPRARGRSVVVVAQDPALFAWTVRENLRLYRPDATDAEIEQAARVADVHEVVCALSAGYDTVLAENGEQLSGGQRQRLAIARALLSPAPVLVLDEITSALDAETERRVMDAIAAAPARTTIVIAHRESACSHASRWIELRNGRITAAGEGPPAPRATAERAR
ncbi:ABC-type transport system involved in cytochrome bd biosynthesis fused ATPase/permease subunit [Actinoalloteichus hoggarensis]|uniref:ATP-binding/permease protein CydD n=1 Tax=Actinoalloteichus hoggarensis TaxID=1470176 RepID=A0A221W4K2_9PSEU|nr:ATP-binding cassette domain-containing protein [Actinoalloteichus hoggarensis]ASO20581.1 ATP-binding/permease protein CydD [Actinoalloteichus hoggarensis]MBB5923622.1 ABC-type transport system involved in cytochrome bd biosynthesis fused ATPase/permease subunit [Actinoalloteichus hoggarensis]